MFENAVLFSQQYLSSKREKVVKLNHSSIVPGLYYLSPKSKQ